MDKRFIFVSLNFRKAEIDFDVGFIVRPTNFSLNIPFLIILYTNIKNYEFFIFILYISEADGSDISDNIRLNNLPSSDKNI
jgi:hypothetical protein